VLAANVTSFTTTGQAAVADRDDSVWRVWDGGDVLEHCYATNGKESGCVTATWSSARNPEEDDSEAGYLSPLAIIDPRNLGGYAFDSQTTGGNGHGYYTWGGAYVVSDERAPATRARGIWVRNFNGAVYHCQIEAGRPHCRRLPVDSMVPQFLGAFTVNETDVLWLEATFTYDTGIERGAVIRCVATPDAPEPKCVPAKMQ
jgi:hypothetical protein